MGQQEQQLAQAPAPASTPAAGNRQANSFVRINVHRADVREVRFVDTDMVVILKDGKKIYVPDGAIRTVIDPSFHVTFMDDDTGVAGNEVLQRSGTLQLDDLSTTTGGQAGNATAQDTANHDTTGQTADHDAAKPATPDAPAGAPSGSETLGGGTSTAAGPAVAHGGGADSHSWLPSWAGPALSVVGIGASALGFLAGSSSTAAAAATTGSGGGGGGTLTSLGYEVTGAVWLGPVTSQLKYVAYDQSGNVLGSGMTTDTGSYTFRIVSGYKGSILVAVTDPTANSIDYVSEATDSGASLGSATLRAVGVADGVNDVTLNVSSVTELAVQATGVGTTATVAPTAATVTAANTTVAQLFGLNNPTTDTAALAININGSANTNFSTSSTASQNYGKALAALAGLDSSTATQATLSGLDVITPTDVNAGTVKTVVANSLSPLAPTIALGTAASLNGTNVLNVASPTMTVVVNYSWMSVGDTIRLTDENGNTVQVLNQSGASVSSYTVDPAESAANTATITVAASGFTSTGTHTISATVSNAATLGVASTGGISVLVDAAAPAAPIISAVAGDDIVNANEESHGVSVSGTAEANSKITVHWGNATATTTADGSGGWTAQFSSGQVPSDGSTTVSATATDEANNTGLAGTRTVTVDTTAPQPPTFDSVTSNNIVGAEEKRDGVTVTGHAEPGSTVSVMWGTATVQATEDASGNWAAFFNSSQIPSDGTTTVSATATDAAGNTGRAGTHQVTVDTVAPLVPTIYNVTGDNIVSATEKMNGVTVSGTAEANSYVAVAWGNTTETVTQTVTANGSGVWDAFFSSGQIPSDGQTTVSATATDPAGNQGPTAMEAVTVRATAPPPPTIFAVTGDDIVNLGEKNQGVTVSGTAQYGTTVTVDWGGTIMTAVASTPTSSPATGGWSVFYSTAQVPADGVQPVTAYASDPYEGTGNTATDSVTVVTTQPSIPTIDMFAGDNIVNASDKTNGITITGTAQPGISVTVTLGTSQETVFASNSGTNSGKWSAFFSPTQIPADGFTTVTATATNIANTASPTASSSLLIDTVAPLAPTLNAIASDNIVNAGEKTNGVMISGTAEDASTVSVAWGTLTKSVKADATSGAWSVNFGPSEVPADGSTTVTVTATDTAGNTGPATVRTVPVDTVAPDLPKISTVAGNDVVSSGEKAAGVLIAGTSEDNALVSVMWGNTTQTTYADSMGNWETNFIPSKVPADGSTTVSVTATDAAGNTSMTAMRAVTVQTVGLPVTINAVEGNNYVNAAEKTAAAGVTISGTAGADASISVNWAGVIERTTADPTNGTWSVNYTSLFEPSDGSTTVTVTAVDQSSNTSTATQTVVVDTMLPAAPMFTLPIAGDNTVNGNEKSHGVTIAGTSEAGASVKVTWGTISQTATADPNGNWSTTFLSGSIPADGTTTVTAIATDAAGNPGTAYATQTVTIDTVAPSSPTITTIAGDNRVNNLEKNSANGVIISGTRTEVGSSVSVTWGTTTLYTTALSDGTWSTTFSTAEVPADGTTTVTVTAKDAAGNVSQPATQSVIVDTLAPAAPTNLVVASDNYINYSEKTSSTGVFSVTGKAEAGASVAVKWGSTTNTVTALSDGSWQTTFSTSLIPADGTTTVSATATDAAGNAGPTAMQSVIVDTSAPAGPTISNVTSDNIVSAGEKNAGVTVSGFAEPNSTVSVTWGSTTLQTKASSSDGSWSILFSKAQIPSEGMTTVSATATDAAGNASGNSAQNVRIDTVTTALISRIAGDDKVNQAEAAAGVTVSGTLQSVASVSSVQVTWGSATQAATINSTNGTWSATFSPSQVQGLANGETVVTATATDSLGNVGPGISSTVIVDTAAPAAPSVHLSLDTGGNAAALAGSSAPTTSAVVVTGVEAGATVLYEIGSGGFSSTYTPPTASGNYTVTVEQVDAAGNTSPTSSVSFTVNSATVNTWDTLVSHNGIGNAGSSAVAVNGFTDQYAIFSSPDATQFGYVVNQSGGSTFSDPNTTATDLFADSPDNQLALITHSVGNVTISAGASGVAYVNVLNDYVIFSAPNAGYFGSGGAPFLDSNQTVTDLFAYNLATGQQSLITHGTANTVSGETGTVVGVAPFGDDYLFTSTAISTLGQGGTSFANANASAADLLLYDATTGALHLVTHDATAGDMSSSLNNTVTFNAATDHYVIFSDVNGGLFGNNGTSFTDATPTGGNALLAYDINTGNTSLINHDASIGNLVVGADQLASYAGYSGDHVFFYAQDATSFGNALVSFGDASTTSTDLFDYNLNTGVLNIVDHSAASLTSASSGNVNLDGVDGDNIIFQSSHTNLGMGNNGVSLTDSSSGVRTDLFVYNDQTQAISLVTHSASSLTNSTVSDSTASYKGSSGDYIVFTDNNVANFGSGGTSFTDSSATTSDIVAYQISTGAQELVDHTWLNNMTAGNSATFQAITGNYVVFSAPNASVYGNSGSAFTDSNTSGTDLFAYNLTSGTTTLLTHSAASNTASTTPGATFVAVAGNDVIFSAYDATQFGNNGTAFTDNATAGAGNGPTDFFSYNLTTGVIQLLDVNPGASTSSSPAAANARETFAGTDGTYAYFYTNYSNGVSGTLGLGYPTSGTATQEHRVLLT